MQLMMKIQCLFRQLYIDAWSGQVAHDTSCWFFVWFIQCLHWFCFCLAIPRISNSVGLNYFYFFALILIKITLILTFSFACILICLRYSHYHLLQLHSIVSPILCDFSLFLSNFVQTFCDRHVSSRHRPKMDPLRMELAYTLS